MTIYINGDSGITDVNGTAAAPAITGTDTDTGLYFGTNTLGLSTNGTNGLYMDSSQNVGIGTTSPGCKLAIGAAAPSVNPPTTLYTYNSTALGTTLDAMSYVAEFSGVDSNTGRLLFALHRTTAGGTSWTTSSWRIQPAVDGSFTGAGSNRGYIELAYGNSGPYQGIGLSGAGNTTPDVRVDNNGYLLVGINSWATLTGAGSGISGTAILGGYITTRTAGTTSATCMSFRNDNNQVGSIYTNGTATTYLTSSDYRLKENIAPMTGALDKITQLNPVTYNWKFDGSYGQGFIAHELQDHFPEAVGGEKDAVDEDGNIVAQGIDTSYLVATLTKAIQELKAIVDAQQQEIELLKAK